jgi:two-component system, LytTR family, sensor kinase
MCFHPLMRPVRRLALLLLVWSIPGLVSTTQVYVQELGTGGLGFARAAVWQMSSWWAWAALTPLVLHLLERFPLERGVWLRSAPVHLVAALGLAVPHLLVSAIAGRAAGVAFYQAAPLGELVTRLYARHVHLDVVTYLAVLGAGAAWSYHRRLRDRELAAARLEARLVESELRALEMQLHPHFLFNTLNAIAVLVRKQDAERALATLTGLAELLRMTLSERGQRSVSLGREIELTRRYLEIEQTRLGDRLSISVDAPVDALGAEVPTLVLQPLVENAVRHGVAPRPAGGRVAVAAWRAGDRLRLEVSDDGVGLPDGFSLDRAGVGLGNVRARLAQMYPGDHVLEIGDRPGGGVVVSIELPFGAAREKAS